ncbi:MAG: SDR family oxidoreductase [Deltaproteobacteria bacterium]|nr:SDR family oxidoreductase [Deltaproteobacteria bacterium]
MAGCKRGRNVWAPFGQRSTAVHGHPEEVAYPVLFLAFEYANMITGHVLRVDGGGTIT